MFFRRNKSDPGPTPTERTDAQRAAALERLTRFAAEDAARAAEEDAMRVDALRRAHPKALHERLAEADDGEATTGRPVDEEIADAVDRLGPQRRENDGWSGGPRPGA